MRIPNKYPNDVWSLDDSLGLGQAGDALARLALEAQPPFTVGVTGKWGCGKTSVMRRAFATLGGRPISQNLRLGEDKLELDGDELDRLSHRHGRRLMQSAWENLHDIADQSLCVWYSPWQHQDADNPLIPLLLEIRAQYSVKRRYLEKAKRLNRQGGLAAWTLLEHAIDAAISFAAGKPVKAAVGMADNVRKAWNEGNPELLAKPGDGQRFHLLFEDAVENLLQDLEQTRREAEKREQAASAPLKEQARLILFIDDLDRCEEKAVVALLEAIKLYLGTQRCVFVLGVDDAAVGDALKRHWHGRSDDSNREYLEKLFQATLPVPLPQEPKVVELAKNQLQAHGFPAEAIEPMAQDIAALLEPNPRKVKNFLNSLCANWQVLRCQALENPEACRRLAMFQYLRLNHRPVWRMLEREPALLGLLARVIATDNVEPVPNLPDSIDRQDLRMAEEIFSRSFAHVLKHTDDDMAQHRKQSLDKAADTALERLDRQRSDRYFVHWARTVGIGPGDAVASIYLRIGGEGA